MTRAIRITRLAPREAVDYRALMLEAYATHPEAFTSSVAERAQLPLGWWAARMSTVPDADEAVFGAYVDDTLAGVAGVSFETREKTAHKATLFGMYVPAPYRGLGLGRRLIGAILDHARSHPATEIVQLTVSAGNAAAERLYAACGFEPFGTEPFAVRVLDDYVTKVHMWCRVRPPVAPVR